VMMMTRMESDEVMMKKKKLAESKSFLLI